MTQPSGQRQLRLEIPANLNAVYSNGVVISQTNNEVIFDFVQIMPNDPRARIQSRVVMTPVHAKLLYRALGQNLEIYEQKFGEIALPVQPASLADQLFGGIKPENSEEDSHE